MSLDTIKLTMGQVTGIATANKFGRNPDIDLNETEDIIGSGGIFVPPVTASVVNFASSSTADTSGGTGAQTISVNGLTTNFVEVTEILTLNGQSNVATVNGFWIIHRVIVLTAGTGGTNAGDITGTSTASGTPVMIKVLTGAAQSQFCIYQVPLGKRLLITHIGAPVSSSATVDVGLYEKPFGGVYNLKRNFTLSGAGSSSFDLRFDPYLSYPAKSTLAVKAKSYANNADVSAQWGAYLVNV